MLSCRPRTYSRCHPLGPVKFGKTTLIARFVRYQDRQSVFDSKKRLKGNPDGTMVVEALTKFRQLLVNDLNKLRYKRQIRSFWTSDGRIFLQMKPESSKSIIKTSADIERLIPGYKDLINQE